MRAVRPGMYEYELDALFSLGVPAHRRRRARLRLDRRLGPELDAVSLQGERPANAGRRRGGDGRRARAGRGYAADVTRTVPVSGRFTADQRAIYQLVRDAQSAAERVARPGAPYAAWRDIGAGGDRARGRAPGADRGRGRHLRPAMGRPVPGRAGALHPVVPLHGPRARPRHRARGARSAATLEGHRRVRAGRRLHHRAGRLREHPAARHPARHAQEPRDDREGAAGGRSATTTSASGSRTTTPSPLPASNG